MILRKAEKNEICLLAEISKVAFHSDELIGMDANDGPPGYDSAAWHTAMYEKGCLYTYLDEQGIPVGGAVLFEKDDKVIIGRIFISPLYHRQGYGHRLMEDIEKFFPEAAVFELDTPLNNIRTNALYQKLGYEESGRTDDTVSYVRRRDIF
ncbi:MAG: GNAT family N-acetyltransferase [Erysipelotrichaceae bacterium]|nr:GNAT family N-acetyltransferase [Erysipelotrichaceae bacterium]